MAINVIQWNCNGLNAHKTELQKIISDTNPVILSIQETRLLTHQEGKLSGYTAYRKDRVTHNNASGGVAIYVKDSFHAEPFPLVSELEVIAITTNIPKKTTIASIYLPPNTIIQEKQVEDLIKQLPAPFLLTGDFNSHSFMWGSYKRDTRGKMIENIVNNNDKIVILNDGSATYFSPRSGSLSAIDLTLSDTKLAPNLTWDVLPYPFGNHFPTKVSFPSIHTENKLQETRWTYNKADWKLFAQIVKENLQIPNTEDINQHVEYFTGLITEAATQAIGKKEYPRNNKKSVPWWNLNCKQAVKDYKIALNRYNKHRSTDNLIDLKKKKAYVRRIILESKRNSWRNYVSTITTNTPSSELWNKIRKINGKRKFFETSILFQNSKTITRPQDIANTLAEEFSEDSSNNHYTNNFRDYKENQEKQKIIFETDNNPINNPIHKYELEEAINDSKKKTSPGPDGIPYSFIEHMPEEAINYL